MNSEFFDYLIAMEEDLISKEDLNSPCTNIEK
jgi:hypothetical protein